MTETAAQASSQADRLPKNPFEDWPLDKSYVGKATPREGGGWEIRILAYDPDAKDQARLVGMTECATLKQLEVKTWEFVRALTDDKDVPFRTPEVGGSAPPSLRSRGRGPDPAFRWREQRRHRWRGPELE